MATRAELAPRAIALRAAGLSASEIADFLHVSRSYASSLYTDPDGSKERARKDRYRLPCPRCGTLMDGSNGRTGAPSRCVRCMAADASASAYWTDERVLDAAREWARRFGQPPGADQWRAAQEVDGYRFPATSMCYRRNRPWSSWGAFLEAAGFDGHRGRGAKTWRIAKAAA